MASLLDLIMQGVVGASQPNMQPETPQVTSPVPGTGAGPSTSVPATAAQTQSKRRGGIIGALESVFAPEPGSFWHSALANGLWDAKGGQARYKAGAYDYGNAATTAQISDAKLREMLRAEKQGDLVNVGGMGGVIRVTPEGGIEQVYSPPQPTSETERLIDRWQATTDPTEKALLERAIKGYQYTAPVIEAQTQGRLRVKQATPGKAPSTGGRGGGKAPKSAQLPTGFILEN